MKFQPPDQLAHLFCWKSLMQERHYAHCGCPAPHESLAHRDTDRQGFHAVGKFGFIASGDDVHLAKPLLGLTNHPQTVHPFSFALGIITGRCARFDRYRSCTSAISSWGFRRNTQPDAPDPKVLHKRSRTFFMVATNSTRLSECIVPASVMVSECFLKS